MPKTDKEKLLNLRTACKAFLDGFPHFCECIDFNDTAFDADTVRWFNEVPGQIQKHYDESGKD